MLGAQTATGHAQHPDTRPTVNERRSCRVGLATCTAVGTELAIKTDGPLAIQRNLPIDRYLTVWTRWRDKTLLVGDMKLECSTPAHGKSARQHDSMRHIKIRRRMNGYL